MLLIINRIWIAHEYPRVITIPGLVIRKQLAGDYPMEHELFSAIIRRMMQINLYQCHQAGIPPWSCYLEPDFAVCTHERILNIIATQFISRRKKKLGSLVNTYFSTGQCSGRSRLRHPYKL
jgi:hypothetical protein